jgi:hypothetical protein
MYLFATVFLSAHAELNFYQFLIGNPNELRLLRSALGFRFFGCVRGKLGLSSSGKNNVS